MGGLGGWLPARKKLTFMGVTEWPPAGRNEALTEGFLPWPSGELLREPLYGGGDLLQDLL